MKIFFKPQFTFCAASVISLTLLLLLPSCGGANQSPSPDNVLSAYDHTDCFPMVVNASLTELKDIKSAIESMQSDEFAQYMKSQKYEQYMTGMRDCESTEKLMEELSVTTVPLLDGNANNFSEISFYWERNEIQQLVTFGENRSASVCAYTPLSDRDESSSFGVKNENAVLVKKINCDGVTVYVYGTDGEERFCADVFANDTYVFMRTKGIKSVEELEVCLSRLEFVKIGDLLNESDLETTE